MTGTDRILGLITTSSEQEARNIAQLLVSERKAACVNIIPAVESLFWWKGKLESARESLLVVKTRASLFPQIVEMVKRVHSYEVSKFSPPHPRRHLGLPRLAGSRRPVMFNCHCVSTSYTPGRIAKSQTRSGIIRMPAQKAKVGDQPIKVKDKKGPVNLFGGEQHMSPTGVF